jgi:hypothetical protein
MDDSAEIAHIPTLAWTTLRVAHNTHKLMMNF